MRSASRIRERAQERRVDQAEDQGIRTDPECQAGDGRQGERRAAAKRPQGVAAVCDQVFEPAELPGGAGVFRHARARTEFSDSTRAGVGPRIALLLELVDTAFDVKLQFLIELPIEPSLSGAGSRGDAGECATCS